MSFQSHVSTGLRFTLEVGDVRFFLLTVGSVGRKEKQAVFLPSATGRTQRTPTPHSPSTGEIRKKEKSKSEVRNAGEAEVCGEDRSFPGGQTQLVSVCVRENKLARWGCHALMARLNVSLSASSPQFI